MVKKLPKAKQDLVNLAKELKIDEKQFAGILDSEQYRSAAPKENLSDHVKKGKVVFGALSDTRLNSEWMRPDIYKSLYERFKDAGAAYVFHLGDITDGFMRYPGHTEDVRIQAYDTMLERLLDPAHEAGYPDIGVNTYFIGGNMDKTFWKRKVRDEETDTVVKTDVCLDIQARRPDLVFLGYNGATVKIAQRTKVHLSHPLPGIGSKKPYAISYPLQNTVAACVGGQKPDILLTGYFKRRYEFRSRDIEGQLVGSSIGQTPREKAQNIPAPSVGGVLFEVYFNKDGSLRDLETTDIPFYT